MLNNQEKELILLENLGYLYPNKNSKYKAKYGIYKCFCGNEFKTQITYVNNNHTKSCGCLKRQKLKERNMVHGFRYHRLYGTWKMMIQRCTNPKNINYKYYGEKGIKVCNRWLKVENFIEDMYPSYQEGLTLDRENNNEGYSKDNCRWTTKCIQSRNQIKIRINNTSGYRGVYWNKLVNKFMVQISIKYKLIYLGLYKTALEAAKVYDQYIIDNNLEHTQNGVI